MTLPSTITIREVGARDGLQAEAPIPVEQRLELIDALLVAGVTHLEVTAFVSPKAVLYSSQTMALWARLLLKDDGLSRSFPLSMETQTLGRSPNNNIVMADPVVSTFHARIDRTPEGFTIVDLTSTNGTFVNGKRVSTAILKPRDELQVGGVKLVYLEE